MNEAPGIPANFTELAVAIGRVEEKVSRIADMEKRLLHVEKAVERLEARQPTKVSGWTIVSAVLGIPASLGALIGVIALWLNVAQP
ncbi:hypothetical protein Pan2_24 [Pseudanabaena phage Pan2]|nr:hypothetical protein Pan2_24 [Pseudanabaena phage Pan2]